MSEAEEQRDGRQSLAHRVPDLAALELLLAVARLGSLGAAAREVGVTQPAASSRLRSMERQLGVALVDRSPRGSRLTDAGALVTDWARRVVEAAAAFDAGARALRDRRDSRLRVAASMTIAEYLLPGWLLALHAERPDTAVSLLAGNSAKVAELLLTGEADLGFVEGLNVPTGLDSTVIARDRLIVVTAPGHPWARRRRPLTAQELAGTPLILRERGSGTRQVLGRGARRPGPAADRAVLDDGGEGVRGQRRGTLGPQRTGGGGGAGDAAPGQHPGRGRIAPPGPTSRLADRPPPHGPGPRTPLPDPRMTNTSGTRVARNGAPSHHAPAPGIAPQPPRLCPSHGPFPSGATAPAQGRGERRVQPTMHPHQASHRNPHGSAPLTAPFQAGPLHPLRGAGNCAPSHPGPAPDNGPHPRPQSLRTRRRPAPLRRRL
ncbi:hypothetical protein GCM10017687_65420 [Streptomyces echinatus]